MTILVLKEKKKKKCLYAVYKTTSFYEAYKIWLEDGLSPKLGRLISRLEFMTHCHVTLVEGTYHCNKLHPLGLWGKNQRRTININKLDKDTKLIGDHIQL